MTTDELATILRQHKEWLLDSSKGKRADLRYADLRSADLRSANLSYADLSGANLRSADLSGADLCYSDLRSAYLRSANLRSAALSGADLSGANLPDGCKIYSVNGCGSVRRMTTYRIDTDEIWCGCFHGTFAEFKAKVASGYEVGHKHRNEYDAVIAFFEAMERMEKKGVKV